MSKTEFQDYICLPFCAFYKPGAKEEFLCRGAGLVERLLRRKRLSPEDIQGWRKDDPFPPGQETDLESAVCAGCLFRNEDCDFKSTPPPEDARPCGGLLLLAQLLAAGKITLEELAEVKD
jgi:hypothetical protein